jgi:hypothetical protein
VHYVQLNERRDTDYLWFVGQLVYQGHESSRAGACAAEEKHLD